MISLEYSNRKIPFIDLEDYGRLSFSALTAHPEKGYKFICFNRVANDTVRVKKKVNGEVVEKFIKAQERYSATLDMYFERSIGQQGQKKGVPKGSMPNRLKDWLKKTFKKFITEDKYFPYDRIEEFQKYLAKQDIDKILSKPQRKRKKNVEKRKKKNGKGN
jgi:hypothetical protein